MATFSQECFTYIDNLNLYTNNPDWDELYENAVKDQIPVVRKTTAKLLYFLVKTKKPANILEIGTGSGYSTLWLEKGLPENSIITTLERDKNRYEKANGLFRSHPKIRLFYQDAMIFLKNTAEQFDFVFLDAQKRDYIDFLPLLEERIKPDGILVVDNFLLNGKVISMKPDEENKYRGGVELLKKFNENLALSPYFETLFISIDDGVVIAIRR